MTDDKIGQDAGDRPEPLTSVDAGQKSQPSSAGTASEPTARTAPGRMPLFRDRMSSSQNLITPRRGIDR
jgi:hypothetical protein